MWYLLIQIAFLIFIFDLSAAAGNCTQDPPHNDVKDTLTDVSLIRLANSDPLYDNIGRLESICLGPCDEEYITGNASAVYIGNNQCLTSVHGYPRELPNCSVEFTANGKTYKHKILNFTPHPKYNENNSFDIALITLESGVPALDGLKPYYDFNKYGIFEDGKHLSTYIGYGSGAFCGNFCIYNGNCCHMDSNRRAVKANLKHHLQYTSNNEGFFMSSPSGYDNKLENKRKLIQNEAGSRGGMSGGAVIHEQYGFIGITKGTNFGELEKRILLHEKPCGAALYLCLAGWTNQLLQYCCLPCYFNIHLEKSGSSIVSVSLSHPEIKNWIENNRCDYEKQKNKGMIMDR